MVFILQQGRAKKGGLLFSHQVYYERAILFCFLFAGFGFLAGG